LTGWRRYSGPLIPGLAALILVGCATPSPRDVPSVLLFNGTGTSPNDVAAVQDILAKRHIGYSRVDSDRLNAMSEAELRARRLLIVPGGNYITMGNSLSPATATRIHDAVQDGLNYLGLCAGGLLAGHIPDNGLDLAEGARFDFYAIVNQGVHKAAVTVAAVGAPALEHYWEDGPQFTGWGAVVGRYPDGTPAIVEGRSGRGWVILVGTHPEAPESWRRGMQFSTPACAAIDYAGTLVDAALKGTALPHY
jgi:glutamine amidotransferase-like uncharacterized protein